MSKVTSKLQVTLPKAIADQFEIRPGDEIEWEPAGDVIRVLPPGAAPAALDREQRLRIFDAATRRQAERQAAARRRRKPGSDRGWTREELYQRDGPG
ncbi:MAG: AbrB/MazE/SpoVT family DNA-binding domain-containing protein [Acidobacteria bacterium]|nr:AbrB/MazE/SpoVT family DNA-binding domain-containing protein [Acidobacteriota bacterium]